MCFVWLDVKLNERPTSVEKLTEDTHVVFLPTPSYRRKITAYVGCFDSNCPISIAFPVIYVSRRRLASTMTLHTLEAVNSLEHTIQPKQTYTTVPRGFRLFGEVRTRSYLAFSDWPNSPFPVLLVRDFFLSCGLSELLPMLHLPFFGLVDWLIDCSRICNCFLCTFVGQHQQQEGGTAPSTFSW